MIWTWQSHAPAGTAKSTQSPRYDFEPITHRKPVRFPKGERLAVIIYVNIEHAPFGSTAPAHAVYPGTMQFSPDILNHGWRDYGNRVGLWRIMQAMDRHGYRGTVNLQSDVCREYPLIIREGNDRNWEWGAQGDNNTSILTTMGVDQQRAFINKNLKIIEDSVGKRPRGWLGMCLAESFDTPDLLALWSDTTQSHALFAAPDAPLLASTLVIEGRYPALSPYRPGAAGFERTLGWSTFGDGDSNGS